MTRAVRRPLLCAVLTTLLVPSFADRADSRRCVDAALQQCPHRRDPRRNATQHHDGGSGTVRQAVDAVHRRSGRPRSRSMSRHCTIDTTDECQHAASFRGRFNAVIVATMHNTVYVSTTRTRRSRGAEGRTVPLWATWLGPPRPGGKDIDMWSTNDPEWGIFSTPVVSPDKQHAVRGRLA